MGECELKKGKKVLPEESGVPPYSSYVGPKLTTFLSAMQIFRIIQVIISDLFTFYPGIRYHLVPHIGFPNPL